MKATNTIEKKLDNYLKSNLEIEFLAESSIEINQEEQNSIVTAGVGQTFLITSAVSRTSVQIVSSEYVKKLFGE